MVFRIRQVKKEIRVLGIAVERSGDEGFDAVGVVFRGSLWLDGVMSTHARGPDLTQDIAEMIVGSSHLPQIRVLLLEGTTFDGSCVIDPFRLSCTVVRPLIVLSPKVGGPKLEVPAGRVAECFELKTGDAGSSILAIGLRRREAIKVIDVTTGVGSMPEALRVAKMVASAVRDLKQKI